jgi:single-stranded-DNA-specific exonuclease
MKDMAKAVDRIVEAISQQEKILVFGDYDVDGTTAVATMYQFLKKIYEEENSIFIFRIDIKKVMAYQKGN